MVPSPASNPERWLREQYCIIEDLFAQATSNLQAAGIRVLTGSHPPMPEVANHLPHIRLTPLRFSNADNEAALELKIRASTSGGPPRYIVTVEIRDTSALQALRLLSLKNDSCWRRIYVGRGLWVTDAGGTRPFNDLSLISENGSRWMTLSAVFLHSERGRAIQEGIMVMGVLYRSLLDELCGASRMGNLAAALIESLGGNTPQFERAIRP